MKVLTPGQADRRWRDVLPIDWNLDVVVMPMPDDVLLPPGPSTDPPAPGVTAVRRRLAFSLTPRYGFYVWNVWMDDDLQGFAEPYARWVPHPDAVKQPVWNPVVRTSVERVCPFGWLWTVRRGDWLLGRGWTFTGWGARRAVRATLDG